MKVVHMELAMLLLAASGFAQTKIDVTTDHHTANYSHLINAVVTVNTQTQMLFPTCFSGFNYDLAASPVPYNNTSFQMAVKSFSPGVLRYPGGTISDTFNWRIGGYDLSLDGNAPAWTMNNIFRAYNTEVKGVKHWAHECEEKSQICMSKGGLPLADLVNLAKRIGDLKIVICVNTITDTPHSAHDLAYRVAKERMPVTVFSLGNECYSIISPTGKPTELLGLSTAEIPSNVSGTFISGEDYAEKMIPYYDAIKSGYRDAGVNPERAIVAVTGDSIKMYDIDPGNHMNKSKWDNGLIHFAKTNARGQYWDAVDLHEYVTRAPTLDASIKRCNSYLVFGADSYINNVWQPYCKPGTKFLFTEYAANDELDGTLYGGLFCAEFAIRLSRLPGVLHVMNHLRRTLDGIYVPDYKTWENKLIEATKSGHKLDLSQVDFRPIISTQIVVQRVANVALNNSDGLFKTTVAGGPDVPAGFNETVQIPAINAQAYHGKNGRNYLLLVNKGSGAVSVQLEIDHNDATRFKVFRVSGNNPALRTTITAPEGENESKPDGLEILSSEINGELSLPGYAIARLEW